ncbi:MAG: hypothetical protein FOGNACKC_04884 [Anaerolineae bacterium]|nr:hypothetical protein [Anaerolineae bacterium]
MSSISIATLKKQTPGLALTALLTGAVAISFSAIFVRLSEVGPITTAFWRMLLSFPVFWALLAQQQPARPATPARQDHRWLIAAGLMMAGDLIAWHWSIKFTTIANSVLLTNLAPIFVTIGGWLLFRQPVTRLFVAGMGLAIVGAMMLVGASFSLSHEHMLGDLLALTAAVFYGSYILVVKRGRETHSTATVMAWAAGVSSLVLLPTAFLAEGALFATSLSGWGVLLGLALFSHAGGQGLITFALAHLPASFSSVTLLLQPVLSAVFAWLLLNEALTPGQMLGGLVVLTGIFLARRASLA